VPETSWKKENAGKKRGGRGGGGVASVVVYDHLEGSVEAKVALP